MPAVPTLVLGSSSSHRRALMQRLDIPFELDRPDIDETPLDGEAGERYVERLAAAKAAAVAERWPDAVVIGSDQTCVRDGELIGKPGTLERAVQQLRAASGRSLMFLSATCVLDARSGQATTWTVPTRVRFRTLDDDQIRRYLEREPAVDSAGAFHSEGLGISLLEAISGDDPTALIGLPLVSLCRILRGLGYPLP